MSTQAIVPSGAGPVHEAGGRSAPDPSIPDPSIPDLSIIVPLFNEEDNVAPMYEARFAIPPPSGVGSARRKPRGRVVAENIIGMEDRHLDLLRYTENVSV